MKNPRYGSWWHPESLRMPELCCSKAHFASADKLALQAQTVSAVDAQCRQEQRRVTGKSLPRRTANCRFQDKRTLVALFVRVPTPGRVKTRLAADLGNEGACDLYQSIVSDILANVQKSSLALYLFHDGKDPCGLPKAWIDGSSKVLCQRGENIGERMSVAFEDCFEEGVERVVLMGSDIPGIDSGTILSAVSALESHDSVIVPAVDGGYCLIALKRQAYQRGIFHDIPWSTDEVLRSTLGKCDKLNIGVKLLEPLQDIDTMADLISYSKNPAASAVSTNRWIENFRIRRTNHVTPG